jgi:hypothetical protein
MPLSKDRLPCNSFHRIQDSDLRISLCHINGSTRRLRIRTCWLELIRPARDTRKSNDLQTTSKGIVRSWSIYGLILAASIGTTRPRFPDPLRPCPNGIKARRSAWHILAISPTTKSSCFRIESMVYKGMDSASATRTSHCHLF